ncbi:hypothetical protein EV426DRAFT_612395 [Tirmania nivea]|nr:hypothetical protein EV426DRAFT_612395 [Tirmania nivea]
MTICMRPGMRISPLKTSLIVFLGLSALQSSRPESLTLSDDSFHFQSLRLGARMPLKLFGPSMIMSFFRAAMNSCLSILTSKGMSNESP